DLFSAFFMALALQNAWLYLRNPEHEELTLLVMTLLMLANIRYESPIYLPAILLALLAMGRLPDKKGLLRLLMLCSPLVLPIFWQRLLPSNNYEQPAGTPLFSLHAFTENIRELLRSQFVFSYEMPYNNLLIIAAAAFSLTLLAPAVRKKLFTGIRPQFAVLCGTVVGISMLINCAQFFIPIYTHPTGARLFLAFCAACTLITTAYLAQAFKIGGRVLLGAGVAIFMLYSPLAAARHLSNKLLLVRTTNTGYDFLSKYPDKHLVVIVNRPGQYVAMNRGAVSFAYANKNPQELLDNLRDNFISDLVVFQDMDYATTLPKARQTLSAEFTLEPVQDIQTGPDTYLRISKVAIPPPGGA
ncbi:MAG: hypothetical protein GX410_00195, partial [Elusimicrobia bacterium]|nr:hypothetical protein [Elusimicrobiota bacterium]